ncbi:MAG TPA: hypothetical protein EYN06_05320 [Myxococcales bacterium]|nr:hypothetical protein [Myxococcales bacterium]HIN85883.1 hypothetical protein [Myxococcales bacterium]
MSASRTQNSSTAPYLALAVVLLAYVALSLLHFDSVFIFHGDHERDLRFARLLALEGIWPTASPSISPLPFELGPLLYFILTPAMWVSSDPTWIRAYMLLLNCGACSLLWLFMRRFIAHEFATFAIFGLLASTFSFEATRQLWHSSLLPLPIAGFLWSSGRLLLLQSEPKKDAVIAAVCAAIAVQLHLCAVVYVALFALLLVIRAKRLKLRGIAITITAFLVAVSPMLLGMIAALWNGAWDRASGAAGSWSPADVGTVWNFFVDNIHTVWGDNLGPLLTWPFVTLILLGGIRAIVKGGPIERFLVANLILGFVIESLLLGNQQAFRYMHANLFAAFALSGLGASTLLSSLNDRVRQGALALLVTAIIAEAALSPVPHSRSAGWLNTNEQRAVAALVAEHFPMDEDTMETHVHGLYFGETMGLGYFHSRLNPDALQAKDKRQHVLVKSSDLKLNKVAKIIKSRSVEGNGRRITAMSFIPIIDLNSLQVTGPSARTLMNKWRRDGRASRDRGTHSLTVIAKRKGRVHLGLGKGRHHQHNCPVSAALNGQQINPKQVHTVPYPGLSLWALNIPKKGTLKISVGPCAAPRFVDLW